MKAVIGLRSRDRRDSDLLPRTTSRYRRYSEEMKPVASSSLMKL